MKKLVLTAVFVMVGMGFATAQQKPAQEAKSKVQAETAKMADTAADEEARKAEQAAVRAAETSNQQQAVQQQPTAHDKKVLDSSRKKTETKKEKVE